MEGDGDCQEFQEQIVGEIAVADVGGFVGEGGLHGQFRGLCREAGGQDDLRVSPAEGDWGGDGFFREFAEGAVLAEETNGFCCHEREIGDGEPRGSWQGRWAWDCGGLDGGDRNLEAAAFGDRDRQGGNERQERGESDGDSPHGYRPHGGPSVEEAGRAPGGGAAEGDLPGGVDEEFPDDVVHGFDPSTVFCSSASFAGVICLVSSRPMTSASAEPPNMRSIRSRMVDDWAWTRDTAGR